MGSAKCPHCGKSIKYVRVEEVGLAEPNKLPGKSGAYLLTCPATDCRKVLAADVHPVQLKSWKWR